MSEKKRSISETVCCGCGGCSQVCPVDCIKIEEDEDGFYKAFYNEKRCIQCKQCMSVCPMQVSIKTKFKKAYAAVSNIDEIYWHSSSGGVFSHAAEKILEKKGTVWGCGYDDNLRPVHMEVSFREDIDRIRRSKYVQSNLKTCYSQIKRRLKDRYVLFVGTPCQVSGLKLFLGREYDNLFTIDLICHGVPSSRMFMENKSYIEKKRGKNLKNFEFRLKDKLLNTDKFVYSYKYSCGSTETGLYYKDAFFNEFYSMTSLNECCYVCPYASLERAGDMTIGDYGWGKKYHPEFLKYNDISCILVNTEKGLKLLNGISDKMTIVPTKIEYILERNKNLMRPTLRPAYRDQIYKEINEIGYEKWADKYFHSVRYLKNTPLLYPIVRIKVWINKLRGKR